MWTCGLRAQAREHFGLPAQGPVLLVTGGSQGAQRLNEAVSGAAAQLVALPDLDPAVQPATVDPAEVLLSVFDPMFIGIDEFGQPVHLRMIFRNILLGAEPGGGKSNLLNLITAHAALDPTCRLVLLDGKQVELGQWEDCADVFVGLSVAGAVTGEMIQPMA